MWNVRSEPDFIRTDTYQTKPGESLPCISNCFSCSSSGKCSNCVQGFFYNPHTSACEHCPKKSNGVLDLDCKECVMNSEW